jgi:hypothetical protein
LFCVQNKAYVCGAARVNQSFKLCSHFKGWMKIRPFLFFQKPSGKTASEFFGGYECLTARTE